MDNPHALGAGGMLCASYPSSSASGHPVGGARTAEFLTIHKQGDRWGWNRPARLEVAKLCHKHHLDDAELIWLRLALFGARP